MDHILKVGRSRAMCRAVAVFPDPGTPTNVTKEWFLTCSNIAGKLCISINTLSSSLHLEVSFSIIAENVNKGLLDNASISKFNYNSSNDTCFSITNKMSFYSVKSQKVFFFHLNIIFLKKYSKVY